MHQKKSQAALEFLTTYGWAFLVILIAISTLWYFGILDPKNFTPEKCQMDGELTCVASSIQSVDSTTGVVRLRLKNTVGENIILNRTTISHATAGILCETDTKTTIKRGEYYTVFLPCTFGNAIRENDKELFSVEVKYYDIRSGNEFMQTSTGDLAGKVNEFIALASGTVSSFVKISDTEGNFGGTLDNWDLLGSSASSLGYLDGDGITDLAAGAYADDDGGSNRGAVYILFMD